MSAESPMHFYISPNGMKIYFRDATQKAKNESAIIYFALAGSASLFQDPYNQPVVRWNENGIRVFSWDLPFHGPDLNPQFAMQHWAEEFDKNPNFIADFTSICRQNIDFLVENQGIDPERIAIAGLSRGAFLASHVAAVDSRCKYILGFAPLTTPKVPQEFQNNRPLDEVALTAIVEKLIRKPLRFYIGNLDTRVGTDFCYRFITSLVDASLHHGIRSPAVELMIYPSIGHKGHGTPPLIFREGADWLIHQLQTTGELL
jgi:dienelactone hydrolase